ncbi:hypothetical protein C8R47DRAFT_1071893 [Mycena vitilis]|nr:hypothetical protein C8R47DRAFT_1071893 [Mycena vitilis]
MSCHSSSSFDSFRSSFESSSTRASSPPAPDSSCAHLVPESSGYIHPITALHEIELRMILKKLATKPAFQRALRRELRRRSEIKKELKPLRTAPPDAICANCQQVCRDTAADRHCAFHPGHIEERVFEFFSRTPDGRPLTIRRTLAMWTCCAEDYQTVGILGSFKCIVDLGSTVELYNLHTPVPMAGVGPYIAPTFALLAPLGDVSTFESTPEIPLFGAWRCTSKSVNWAGEAPGFHSDGCESVWSITFGSIWTGLISWA